MVMSTSGADDAGDAGLHGVEHAATDVVAVQAYGGQLGLQRSNDRNGGIGVEVVDDQDLVVRLDLGRSMRRRVGPMLSGSL